MNVTFLVAGNTQAISGILIAHSFHLFSVLMLYQLTLDVFSEIVPSKRTKMAFLAAILHVFTPAGMFLSAPYAESSFSFLNFLGYLLYSKTFKEEKCRKFMYRDCLFLLSGITFGIASTFRGNGLFSGCIFIYDAITAAVTMLRTDHLRHDIRRLLFVIFAGLLMGIIALMPQYLAYREYCTSTVNIVAGRPWCSRWVPSIYAWVQEHYWYCLLANCLFEHAHSLLGEWVFWDIGQYQIFRCLSLPPLCSPSCWSPASWHGQIVCSQKVSERIKSVGHGERRKRRSMFLTT